MLKQKKTSVVIAVFLTAVTIGGIVYFENLVSKNIKNVGCVVEYLELELENNLIPGVCVRTVLVGEGDGSTYVTDDWGHVTIPFEVGKEHDITVTYQGVENTAKLRYEGEPWLYIRISRSDFSISVEFFERPSGKEFVIYSDNFFPAGTEIWRWQGADLPVLMSYPSEFDHKYENENSPEGNICFRVKSGANQLNKRNYAGWGIFSIYPSDHTIDLSSYNYLKFWVKTPVKNLKVEVMQDNRDGAKVGPMWDNEGHPTSTYFYIDRYGWDNNRSDEWQEITIPASAFSVPAVIPSKSVDMSKIFCPFMVTVENPLSGTGTEGVAFYIDNVRWTI